MMSGFFSSWNGKKIDEKYKIATKQGGIQKT
jgi:hypothetical protein